MSDVAAVLTQRQEPKFDRWGRYSIRGKSYTRVTTWADSVGDRYNLEQWKVRMAALGLVARQDLYAAIAATPAEDKKKLGALCDKAIEAAKGSAGANLGTALHAFTERVDMGEEIVIPAPWNADVEAYKATLASARAEVDRRYVERIVVHHGLGIAGTFDRLLGLPDLGLVVGDVKTGGFLDWGAIAIQLACYANAEHLYDPATDELEPMPFVNLDTAVVIHLPVGQASCTLYAVDIRAGWEMAQTVGVVRRWRSRKDLSQPLASVATPEAEVRAETAPEPADEAMRAWLVRRAEQVRDAGHLDDLAAAWPAGVPTFRQADHHAGPALRKIDAALRAVEQRHGLTVPNFDGTEHVAPTAVAQLVNRLEVLPGPVLAVLQGDCAGRVPNVRSAKFTADHAAILEPLLAAAEQAAAAMRAVTDGDDQMAAAILDHAQDLGRVAGVCDDIAACRLNMVPNLEGQWTVVEVQAVGEEADDAA